MIRGQINGTNCGCHYSFTICDTVKITYPFDLFDACFIAGIFLPVRICLYGSVFLNSKFILIHAIQLLYFYMVLEIWLLYSIFLIVIYNSIQSTILDYKWCMLFKSCIIVGINQFVFVSIYAIFKWY